MLLQRSTVLGRRHARGPPKRAGEARLRGKLAIEGDLAERCESRRDHCLGALQPPSADVAMRRHAHGDRSRDAPPSKPLAPPQTPLVKSNPEKL